MHLVHDPNAARLKAHVRMHILARELGAHERNPVLVAHCVSFNEILEARHDAKGNGAAAAGVQHDALGSRLLSRRLPYVDPQEPLRFWLLQLDPVAVGHRATCHVFRLRLVALLLHFFLLREMPQARVGAAETVLADICRVLQQRTVVGSRAHLKHQLAGGHIHLNIKPFHHAALLAQVAHDALVELRRQENEVPVAQRQRAVAGLRPVFRVLLLLVHHERHRRLHSARSGRRGRAPAAARAS